MSRSDRLSVPAREALDKTRDYRRAARHRRSVPRSRFRWIHSRRLHVFLYSFLMVATPFIFLRNFLIEFISRTSSTRIPIAGVSLPLPAVAGGVVVAVLLVLFFRRIRLRHVVAVALAVLMDVLAQQIADYYFGHNFYDLQQNWHYIAYGLFAYMLYRDLAPRGYRLSRIMLLTACCAFLFSAFDETFQLSMSNRVFDVGDTAKDVWGTLMGMVIVYLGGSRAHEVWEARGLRFASLRDYVNNPFASLVWMIVFGFVFLCVGSWFSDVQYLWIALTATVVICGLVFVVVHLTQFRRARYALAVLLVGVMSTQAYSAYRFRHTGVSFVAPNLAAYDGVPLPLFDYLFFTDGTFRPVDKLHFFNGRDRRTLLGFRPDILVVGAGYEGRGGLGFPDKTACLFVYNSFIRRGTQVFILPTPQACDVYNRLRKEQRNVLFVLHSGC
jgi:hypothetical protein